MRTKVEQRFINSIDNIQFNNKFDDIKNQIKIKNYEVSKRKFNFKPLIPALSVLLLALIILPMSFIINNKTKEKDVSEFRNYKVEMKSHSDSVELSDTNIYINYPMMVNACNLEKELSFNSIWDIYQDGKVVDKSHLDLSLGEQTYDLYLYKLNNVEKVYKVNIQVGD